jgi:NADH-quinone oxidoreductase subunit F
MDFDGLKALGSGLGTAAVIVMDKSTDIAAGDQPHKLFLTSMRAAASAPPCREGAGWMWRMMEKLRVGDAESATSTKLPRRHQAGRRPHNLRFG